MIEPDPFSAPANRIEMLSLQIGRQARIVDGRVTPAKRLPGEIVVLHGEVAGEALDAALEHLGDAVGTIAGERAILGGRDAEPIERRGAARQPAHQALLEQRRDLAVEGAPLLGERRGRKHSVEMRAIKFGDRVAGADEFAEQAFPVKIPRESVDAPAAREVAALPIGAAHGVEPRAQLFVVDDNVVARVGAAEKIEELVDANRERRAPPV